MASHAIAKPGFLTYRVQCIPYGLSKEQLKGHFYVEDRDDIKVKSLCPAVDTPEGEEGDFTATIFFRPHDNPRREPRIAIDVIDIDKTFIGFTPLYVPPKEKGPIAADIIAISGLAGHAYGSWAHSPEHMWIRDYLPRDAPNARILTYGYPATLQGNTSISTIQDYTTTFVQNLIGMRESAECASRPIIFIGHSLGCLIIKKALADIALLGVNPSRLPVRTIIFLAAPHRGLNVTAMQTLVKGQAAQALIDELAVRSRTLNEINQQFAHVAGDIEILTCYETKPTKTAIQVDGIWVREGEPALMVELDSAQLYFPKEQLMSAEADHKQIAKVKKGEGGIYPRIKSSVRQSLVNTARIVASAEARPEPHTQSQSNLYSVKDVTPPYSPSVDGAIPVTPPKLELDKSKASPGSSYLSHEPQLPEVMFDNKYGIKIETGAKDGDEEEEESEEESDDENAENRCSCDVCGRTCRTDELVYNCLKCYDEVDDESYDICERCYRKGAKCPEDKGDGTHNLSTSILRGLCYLRYPSRTIHPSDNAIVKAIKTGDTAALQSHRKKKKTLNASTEAGLTPIILAIQLGLGNMVKTLLDMGASPEVRDDNEGTPLSTAIRYIYPSIVEMLLDYGADANAKEADGSTPLIHAIILELPFVVDMLLEHGADVNCTGAEGEGPPLHEAIELGSLEILEIILKRKPIIDAVHNGDSPLIAAYGFPSFVKLLLEAGANANFRSRDPGMSPLLQAAMREKEDIVQILLQHGATIEAHDRNKCTALLYATRRCNIAACRILLDAGAQPNTYDSEGITPLMSAAEAGSVDIVKLLLKRKANVNWTSDLSWSALTLAAKQGNLEIVQLLIGHGALSRPTPYRKWKDFIFLPKVSIATQNLILDAGRPVEHSPMAVNGGETAGISPRASLGPATSQQLSEWDPRTTSAGGLYYVNYNAMTRRHHGQGQHK